MERKIGLITGATAGIGKVTAKMLSKHPYDLILTGRRKERLEEINAEIENESEAKVLNLAFDIRNRDEVKNAIQALPPDWQNIDVLINNAGLASGLDLVHEGDIEDWEKMIDTNVKGLLYITRAVSPGMVQRESGHIVNIGSIAGKEIYEKGNVYVATKHAVDALTRAMRIDLLRYGIKVTQIAPGAVDTEFSTVRFHGDKAKADSVYEGYTPLYAEDIAEAILFALTRPAHVNINDLLIMPTAQASVNHLHRKS